jgi:hypothetical protein
VAADVETDISHFGSAFVNARYPIRDNRGDQQGHQCRPDRDEADLTVRALRIAFDRRVAAEVLFAITIGIVFRPGSA